MADSADRIESLEAAWSSFGRVLAVVAAALVALIGTIAHVPVWLAVARGLGTLVVVLLIVRGTTAAVRALPRRGAAAPADTGAARSVRRDGA
jgi:hypothetical protein